MHTQTDSERDLEMLEDCQAVSSRLTQQEGIFIERIGSMMDNCHEINERERMELKRIWQEVTNKGISA